MSNEVIEKAEIGESKEEPVEGKKKEEKSVGEVKDKVKRDKPIPEYKLKAVEDLKKDLETSKTVLLASTSGLPGGQYHEIKKKLRGKADVKVTKKSLLFRAIDKSDKKGLQELKENIGADIALFFSDLDAFELSGILGDYQSPVRAKGGDIAPEDIEIEPGPTELMPGPVISELSSVGLKVAVEDGKIAIKQGATVVKEGEEIDENLAGVLSKLGVIPMKAGFEPLSAYDAEADKVYVGIKIDKEGALEELRTAIGKAFGFAVGKGIVNNETVKYFIAKAGLEAGSLEGLEPKAEPAGEEKKEADTEVKAEEVKTEEKTEEVKADENSNSKEDLENLQASEKASSQSEEEKQSEANTEAKEDNE